MIFGLEAGMPVIIQGITGHQGMIHSIQMRSFGTNVVAGVVPGKGGSDADGLPVFNTVEEAMAFSGSTTSVIFVPALKCLDAAKEALDAGVKTMVIVTEHLPLKDAMILRQLSKRKGVWTVGPNCPGIGVPGKIKLGIMPNQIFKEGEIGVISRSGTLTYELVQSLTDLGIGQRYCVGVGGDQIPGASMADVAAEYCKQDDIKAILLIGEIGGRSEIEAGKVLDEGFDGLVMAYLAGRSAPPGKRMGHAGAILSKGTPSIDEKRSMLVNLGIVVCDRMEYVAPSMKNILAMNRH